MILDLPAERWRRIEPLLDQVLDLPPAERDDLLDSACGGDQDLRAAVAAFLAADEAAGGFLETPAGEYAVDLLAEEGTEKDGEDLLKAWQMGRYCLVREIGSGGMGVVYEAEDTRLRRRVAVKLLPLAYSRDSRAKERFLREAQAASRLDHPRLCPVYDFGESEGRLFIVLAFYEGETLKERLRQGPLPVAEARGVAIQMARGLDCAHEAGIIHRDIKPANVMLTRRGEVKILDFGVAKHGGEDISLTPTGGSWGTPAYMSPEQVRGEPVDGRTDVWSLGVVLYEMLAGQRPFGGDGMQAVLASILTREPEPLRRLRPEVPPELARLVERALAKDPAERCGSALELSEDLKAGRAPKAGLRLLSLRRTKALAAGLVVSTVLALLLAAWSFGWLPRSFAFKRPLRVAVLNPEVVASSGDLSFVVSEVVDSTLSTLVSLEGIEALDPPESDEGRGSKLERFRSGDADEVLSPRLECRDGWCELSWHRSGPGGTFRGEVGPVSIQTGIENAYQLAEAVRAELPKAYDGHPLRSDAPAYRVRREDYATYIDLESRFDRQGFRLGLADLERLDSLIETSPGLVGAYLLAEGIARGQGEAYRDRALGYVTRAEEIAPYDPRPLLARVRIEVEGGRLPEAETTLERLRDLAPTDARVTSARAEFLEAWGELKKARALRQEIAQRRPHWRNTVDLVRLEFRMGEGASARRLLDELLEAHPENVYVRENLAAVEIVFGDPRSAVKIYRELIAGEPTDQCWANLGFAHFVLGDYPAAERAFRRALELNPDYLLTRFNLASVLEARGDADGARRLCSTLVKELEAEPTRLGPILGLLDAQCLVRLGRREDATRLADRVFEQWPEEEVQFFFRAAQLYALLGKRSSALHYADEARKRGLRPEWLRSFPEFRSLQNDPELRSLLAEHPAP